jgi:hypothetical protein
MGSLEPITVRARQREIRGSVVSSMLSRPNMFDVEPNNRCILLWQKAVLTPVACPLANKLTYGLIHQLAIRCSRTERAFACKTVMKSITEMYVSYSSHSAGVNWPSFHLSASSSINTGLGLLINAKINQSLGDFRREQRPKRIKKAVEYVRSHHMSMISHRL